MMNDTGRPQSSKGDHLQDLLVSYQQRLKSGENVDTEEFIAAHPDMADLLRPYLEVSTGPNSQATIPPSTKTVSPQHRTTPDSGDSPQRVTQSAQQTVAPKPQNENDARELAEQFGRYRIERCLGRGAMGAVYLAVDTQLDRHVALKIPNYTAEDGSALLERFYREARTAATLRNANICPVHDVGEIDGVHYLTMAYIDGHPLSERIGAECPYSEREIAQTVRKLALALEEAHSKGIVHRDLKPANIMIDEKNEPIVMDFGLARRSKSDDARLTQNGAIIGSPAYMSPEQVEGNIDTMGPACDIYSLGVILFELLTGQLPFKGSIAAVIGQIVVKEAPKPSELRAKIDPRLDAVCVKMMAKSPDDRFDSMDDVANALNEVINSPPSETVGQSTTALNGVGKYAVVREPEPSSSATEATAGQDELAARLRPPGTAVIPHWMLWTALVIAIAGFGMTWTMMAVWMRHTVQESVEFQMGSAFEHAFAKEEVSAFLDGKQVGIEAFSDPHLLDPGTHKLIMKRGDEELYSDEFVVAQGESLQLKFEYVDGIVDVKRVELSEVEREAAEWVLGCGGTVNLGEETIVDSESLPAEAFYVTEIDLSGNLDVTDESLGRFKSLSKLDFIDLSNTKVTDAGIDALQTALPDCSIMRQLIR